MTRILSYPGFSRSLAQQAVGVLVAPALPRAVRVAEVDGKVGCDSPARMVGQFCSAILGQRRYQPVRQPLYLPGQGIHHGAAVLAVHLDEHNEPRPAFDQGADMAVLGA